MRSKTTSQNGMTSKDQHGLWWKECGPCITQDLRAKTDDVMYNIHDKIAMETDAARLDNLERARKMNLVVNTVYHLRAKNCWFYTRDWWKGPYRNSNHKVMEATEEESKQFKDWHRVSYDKRLVSLEQKLMHVNTFRHHFLSLKF